MPEPNLMDLSASLRRNEPTLPDYLNELEAHFGRREPQVTAFLPEKSRFARLRREAEALVSRYPDPESRPLLFGAPVGVKDIFHADGFITRAGASIPAELLQGREGPAVSALRAAGAMILGKTITTEFAYFAPGPTRHPLSAALGETRTPGGSSSGSAAAVAARLCPLALGTQTIGSIIRPAAYCGVVGFKPTYGRVSSDGLIPLAPSADTVGFFVRTAADATLVASLLCADWRPVESLRRSPVLGIPEGLYLQRASAEALAHFHRTCDRLIRQGITLRALPVMLDFDDIYARHNDLVAAEAARIHAGWFAAYGEHYHPKTAGLIRRGRGVSGKAYHAALAGRETLRIQLTALMDDQGLDAWICPPAVGPAPSGLESTGDPVMALPWTHAGMPALSLPAGTDPAGWPMGLQIVGRYGQDEQLLAVAAIIEEVIGLP